MKKNIIVSVIGVAAAGLLLSACSAKPESVTALVAGPDGQPAAVVVKYAKAVSAESVTADAFQIEGQEIENVFVTDKEPKPECDSTKAEKHHDCGMDPKECEANNHECCPEEKAPKHECDSTKACPEAKPECEGPKSVDGQFVVILLKKACPEKPACEGVECDSTKAECPEAKPECEKAGKPECEGNHENCEKAACDSTKHECEKAGKPECKEGKPEKCPEIAVPEISVKQVKEIKAADGKALKAWSKAFPATKAVPFFHGPKGPKHPHHGEACPEGKPECDGQHKDCPKEAEAK